MAVLKARARARVLRAGPVMLPDRLPAFRHDVGSRSGIALGDVPDGPARRAAVVVHMRAGVDLVERARCVVAAGRTERVRHMGSQRLPESGAPVEQRWRVVPMTFSPSAPPRPSWQLTSAWSGTMPPPAPARPWTRPACSGLRRQGCGCLAPRHQAGAPRSPAGRCATPTGWCRGASCLLGKAWPSVAREATESAKCRNRN